MLATVELTFSLASRSAIAACLRRSLARNSNCDHKPIQTPPRQVKKNTLNVAPPLTSLIKASAFKLGVGGVAS